MFIQRIEPFFENFASHLRDRMRDTTDREVEEDQLPFSLDAVIARLLDEQRAKSQAAKVGLLPWSGVRPGPSRSFLFLSSLRYSRTLDSWCQRFYLSWLHHSSRENITYKRIQVGDKEEGDDRGTAPFGKSKFVVARMAARVVARASADKR